MALQRPDQQQDYSLGDVLFRSRGATCSAVLPAAPSNCERARFLLLGPDGQMPPLRRCCLLGVATGPAHQACVRRRADDAIAAMHALDAEFSRLLLLEQHRAATPSRCTTPSNLVRLDAITFRRGATTLQIGYMRCPGSSQCRCKGIRLLYCSISPLRLPAVSPLGRLRSCRGTIHCTSLPHTWQRW